jgi:hypothetical protein
MIAALLVALIFVPVVIGNIYEYRALSHRRDRSRRPRRGDIWHSELFDAEGSRLRSIALRFYMLAGAVLFIACLGSALR